MFIHMFSFHYYRISFIIFDFLFLFVYFCVGKMRKKNCENGYFVQSKRIHLNFISLNFPSTLYQFLFMISFCFVSLSYTLHIFTTKIDTHPLSEGQVESDESSSSDTCYFWLFLISAIFANIFSVIYLCSTFNFVICGLIYLVTDRKFSAYENIVRGKK